jgi:ubiquinone/menaquinone biosynthesis C-methylase UbiE
MNRKGGTMTRLTLALALLAGAAGHGCAPAPPARPPDQPGFPAAGRPVAGIVSASWDTEADRDRHGEADRVFGHLRVAPGVRVADVGAGSGYYTVRLARRLGPGAVIYAQDVDPTYLKELRARLAREGITGVTPVLGTPTDPRLPAASVDLALLSHMYHEIANPYAFLHNLRGALAAGGRVAIIDLDRPTGSHGTPPALLRCELGALGYRELSFHSLAPAAGYLAVFARPEPLPAAGEIRPCRR